MMPAPAADPIPPAVDPGIVLDVQGLSVAFREINGPVRAVEDVSFTLRRGLTLALVGESGCGKTVTALSLLRLLRPGGFIERGRVILHPRGRASVDLAGLGQRDERLFAARGGTVGMIFQEPASALSPAHTIGSQVAEAYLLHRPVSRAEARERTRLMLRRVGFPDPERSYRAYPHELSGGMRQRAVIAMALICEPEVLIADEPTSSLDVTLQAQILGLIRQLQAEFGCALLLITHNMGVVARMADEVAVMYLGRVVEQGPVARVLTDPRHPYTIALMRSVPTVSAHRTRLPSIAGHVPALGHLPAGCTFHPRCPWSQSGLCNAGPLPSLEPVDGRRAACFRVHEIRGAETRL